MMRQLKMDLDELVLAFSSSDTLEMMWYLNLQTGEVIPVSDEIRRTLMDVYKELKKNGIDPAIDFAQSIQDFPEQGWVKDSLIEADQVERGLGQSFLTVPHDQSQAAFADMQDFTNTVADENVRETLQEALDGPKPFRRFKDRLEHAPAHREAWFKFKNDRLTERVIDWLREEGIEPIA